MNSNHQKSDFFQVAIQLLVVTTRELKTQKLTQFNADVELYF